MTTTQLSKAVDAFIKEVANLPTYQPLDDALEKAMGAEKDLRHLFATNPHNNLLQDSFLGLVDVFSLDPSITRTRARLVSTRAELSKNHVFPLKAAARRGNLLPSTVPDLKTFRKHWRVFTHGSLSKMTAGDWENVVAAGGSVLACLAPPQWTIPPKDLNELYQSENYMTSDIDLFLWGLSPEEAKIKMENINQAICLACKWNVVCVRKANVVSIHTNYPHCPVQIILRLYQSPAEVLAGFDVDAACCAYDRKTVWVNPRSLAAIIRQANTIDITRRSPSYKMRLAKYASRGFEVYIPSLKRAEVNPAVSHAANVLREALTYTYLRYTTGICRPGQKALLACSFWSDAILITGIIETTAQRPRARRPYPRLTIEQAALSASSNYDCGVGVAKIPYGPKWTAKKIQNLVFSRLPRKIFGSPTLFFKAPHNQLNMGHRHVIFAGTMQECLQSFCSACSPLPGSLNKDIYIWGPITYVFLTSSRTPLKASPSFMTTNPGRQLLTGSFRPIDFGDWAIEAYMH
ncbi:hypothetical protein CVT26_008103 [Gymnopilus dilepis]|uniref:Uncharacterized protein n=1 Tax=Gymnopilus dilepis TaxID=231916 RepID=A0A409WWG1_9AGAR|nr:hypothetical protein CVT26_008103 [Gymnopilus dilepis]